MTHRGKKKAIVAAAHSMLVAIYHVLRDNTHYEDLGSNYYNQFNKEKKGFFSDKKIAALGYTASITAMSEAVS